MNTIQKYKLYVQGCMYVGVHIRRNHTSKCMDRSSYQVSPLARPLNILRKELPVDFWRDAGG